MLVSAVRASLLTIVFLLGIAAPAAASHPPTQHEPQRISIEDALMGADLQAQLPLSSSFECVDGMAGPYPCENVDLEGFVPLPLLGGATGNDIWGWTDPATGREYAMMGTSHGTGFVDVTDPREPILVGTLPTAGIPDNVLWRDIKVDGNYAFIVSEVTGSGMQVFDLTRLRDAAEMPTIFDADAFYDEMSSTHNISINTETDFAYAVGTDDCRAHEDSEDEENGGLHMIDISDPLNPTFAGCAFNQSFADEQSNNYVHDVECVIYDGPDPDYQGREICFGSNENVVAIYDVTDKSNPRVISNTGYPTAAYTHQGALTPDKRYFLFGDELDEQSNGQPTTTYIMDVSDLDSPPTPVPFEHPTASIDHNMYTHGNRVFQSNYNAGFRILEYDDASLAAGQLNEVASFDVVPAVDIAEFAGTWSNFRFPGSGNVVVSTIENEVNGLFVLKPTLGGGGGGGGGDPTPGTGPGPGGPPSFSGPPSSVPPRPGAKPSKRAKKCKKAKG
ncbi:MAG: choice-of-anchor B family protein, partial [Solirubrobacterales bacterium]